ncbi:MAG: glycoside hydrolase family 88 protein [Bacteroidota bacterium]
MKISKFIFFSLILLIKVEISSAQNIRYAENMAKTIMATYPDSMVVMRYVSHLDKSVNQADKNIEQQLRNRPANWNYEIGVVSMGFERLWKATGDFKYYQYIKHIFDKFITEEGEIRTYKMGDYNSDNIPSGRQLLTFYQTQNIAKYKKAADKLKNQIDWMPRNSAGGYWHKLIYPTQMWLDGLYMIEPFHANLAQMTNDMHGFSEVTHQFVLMEKYTRDPKTGLLYHGWDESKLQLWADKKTGQSPNFWSRAMGWYMMGLVDVLDYYPENHPDRKILTDILVRLSSSIVKFQDPTTGTWWQVTNLGGKEGNYLESSASAMFAYSLAKGIRKGYLPKTYIPSVKKAFNGIIKEFVVEENGLTHYIKGVGGAGLGGNPYRDGSYDYYVKEPTRVDDLKAIGPFMQACVEMDMLEKIEIGQNKTVTIDNYFNNEYRNGQKFHYLWDDRFDSGFSWLGDIIHDFGAQTNTLTTAPTAANLKKSNVYIVVDPDSKKETKTPNYIRKQDIEQLKSWVKAGGKLVLLTNDTTNCDIEHSNELAKAFGIHFTNKNINFVKNDQYDQGDFMLSGNDEILGEAKKIYIKEIVTLGVKPPAKSALTVDNEIIMATSDYGKGKVFVLGDPWIYNEYLNGRKLPDDFDNYEAARAWIKWLLK